MFRRKCDSLRFIAYVALGTLIALYCPAKVLIIFLSVSVVILAFSIPRN